MVHDVSQLPSSLREGDIVAGKYRIDGILGTGAMGIVVVACHLLLGEKVAIKFLLPQSLGNGDAVARFLREAQTAVRIKNEHVAHVFDVATLEDGTPFIVMEYLEGNDLAAFLQQGGPLSVEQAVEFILQACEAIAEAHELGIVHRDLKPANLFVIRRADGLLSIKVLDFGISKNLSDSKPALHVAMTDTMVVMGSPAYMSPEQMESARKVDVQTDVWALGAILCELVTGRIPFDGQSLPEVYTKIVAHPQPSIREWAPSLPVGLEDVILKCLRTNRSLRYRDVGDLAAALSEFAPKRAAASVDRIARTLEARKSAGSLDALALPGWSPASPRNLAAMAEKTLHSWGDHPAPATIPSPPRRALLLHLARPARLALAGAGLLLVMGVSLLALHPHLRASDAPAASPGPVSASLPTATSAHADDPLATPAPGSSGAATDEAPAPASSGAPAVDRLSLVPSVTSLRPSTGVGPALLPPATQGGRSAPRPAAPPAGSGSSRSLAAAPSASAPSNPGTDATKTAPAATPPAGAPDLGALDLADPK
ncbi:MAG TPA: protein kinase [Polyangiaceae bacterium]|nr:protein kinase [Polyangiaceae bacterium]